MKIRLNFLTIFVGCLIFFGSVSASYAQDGQITGGYGEASVKDAEVIKAANFAVKKAAKKEKATIKLIEIKKAQMQVVAGLNYEVCLQVSVKKSGKKAVTQYAKAVVYRNLKSVYSLTSWEFIKDSDICETKSVP